MSVKNYVNKITMATIGMDPRELEKLVKGKGTEAVAIARVYGRVNDAKAATSDLGPYTKFSGQFQAENLLTGSKVRSQSLILPAIAEGFISDGITTAKKDDPTGSFEFACNITAIENQSKKGGFQFKYGIQAILGPKDGDYLDNLGAAIPAIEAPAKSKK